MITNDKIIEISVLRMNLARNMKKKLKICLF